MAAVSAVLAALFTPNLPAWAAYNFPAAFGPFSGDRTTPSANSASITYTKSNGTSFASMAFQAASAVAITGASINGTAIGATTASTGPFTTGLFSGTLTGASNTFSSFSAQAGGHQVGTVTVTGAATLTNAQESVCTNGSVPFTLTLPAAPVEGQRIDVSDCGGRAGTNNVTIVASGGGKVNYSSSGLVLYIPYQWATLTYRSAFGWIVS
jgi:hypothetical protein